MYSQSKKWLLASGIALALGTSGAVTAETASQEVMDARQETQIWTTYAMSPYLRSNDLTVVVHEGKATLSGKVDESAGKDLAKQIALGVKGIKEVDNKIVVQSDYVAPAKSAARSYGESIDDATITAAVKSKLTWNKYTEGPGTEVETKGGRVTLKGTATSMEAKDLAGSLAMNTRGVTSVDNQLTIGLPIGEKQSTADAAKSTAHAASAEMADTWITTKVKSTYVYSTNVDSKDIGVSTDKGIVTLSGKVASGAKRALAIELAKNVRGVQSVNSQALTF